MKRVINYDILWAKIHCSKSNPFNFFWQIVCLLWVCVKFDMALSGVHLNSARSPWWLWKNFEWLWKKFVTRVIHGSLSNPSWLWDESVACWDLLLLLLAISNCDRLLSEPWLTSLRAMNDSLQSHHRLLAELKWTPGGAMLSFWQTNWSFFLDVKK